jgi:hypothetical protein
MSIVQTMIQNSAAQGSQRQLTHIGREQIALLNKWTKSFAQRVATAAESQPNNNAPAMQLLASAEAPFADPFLMEFEDQNALQQAYSEAPMTFEQALMAARLDAKKASQVRVASSRASAASMASPVSFDSSWQAFFGEAMIRAVNVAVMAP